jgi:hypothetical protein
VAGTERQPAAPGPAVAADDHHDDGAPMFRVVAIGDQGAGKSNFLAMLFQHLSKDPDSERGYHLSTDLDQGIILNREADKTASPGTDWASKTTWVHDRIDLDFQVPLAGGPASVLRIRCVDYPGEYLRDDTAGSKSQREALEAAITDADVHLMLIDGYRLLKALEKGGKDQREFTASVRATVNLVQAGPMVHKARPAPPLQVLVTKWDFLADAGYTLLEVRDALLREEHFRAMMVTRRTTAGLGAGVAQGRVRIIPVSVVGLGAIQEVLAAEQNGMPVEIAVKKEDIDGVPVNLEVPIAAILPDRLDQILAGLSPRMLKRARRNARLAVVRTQGRKAKRIGGRAAAATQGLIGTVVGVFAPAAEKPSKAMLALIAQWADQKEGASAPATNPSRLVGAGAPLALRTLLEKFVRRVGQFERDFEGWDAEQGLEEWFANQHGGAP